MIFKQLECMSQLIVVFITVLCYTSLYTCLLTNNKIILLSTLNVKEHIRLNKQTNKIVMILLLKSNHTVSFIRLPPHSCFLKDNWQVGVINPTSYIGVVIWATSCEYSNVIGWILVPPTCKFDWILCCAFQVAW